MRLRLMLWLDILCHRYCDWFERWLLASEHTQHRNPGCSHMPARIADMCNTCNGHAVATPVGWSCEHVTMTSGGGITSPRSSCGCDMEPVY